LGSESECEKVLCFKVRRRGKKASAGKADACLSGLRILAKIIARKRLKERSAGAEIDRAELGINIPLTNSTTVLLRRKRIRQW